MDGNTKREKTNETIKIPLLPKEKEIITKYNKHTRPDILRKIRTIYSFSTIITLSHGVPIETVSKMLGHTKLNTTQIYARVLERKVGEDMKNLMDLKKKVWDI